MAVALGQAEPLEIVNDVECEKQELKESYIGNPVLRWDLGQGVIVDQLADMFLDPGSEGIETVDTPCAGPEVGDKDMVSVLGVLEQGQLLSFHRVLGNPTPHHHEAVSPFPLRRLEPKFAHFPAVLEPGEFAVLGFGFDGFVSLGDDHVPVAFSVEKFDCTPAVEARIQSKADARPGNVLGKLGQANLHERNGPSGCGGIAGA